MKALVKLYKNGIIGVKNLKYMSLKGIVLDKQQMKDYLESLASDQLLKEKSDKKTYPVPEMEKNFEYITRTYELLNKHLKYGITIHQAGEWLLDNYYVLEETVKSVKKDLPIKKYVNFIGISSGKYEGFARIYVLAEEIINFTDGILNIEDLEDYIKSYQNKKTLNMEEIWDINLFFKIALIERIKDICVKIFNSQMQKVKVENIIERLVESKARDEQKFKLPSYQYMKTVQSYSENKYTFIEYLSFKLKKYGKKGIPYLNILEEEINKQGLTLTDVIKKEHFDIALKKVAIGNCIKSIHALQRMNFLEIFERINGVEELLKEDPAGIYELMDYKTKEYYRNRIKEVAKKTKISELYIAKKILELATKEEGKKKHIGYYLISNGIQKLYEELGIKKSFIASGINYGSKTNVGAEVHPCQQNNKTNLYIYGIAFSTIIISILFGILLYKFSRNTVISILETILLFIPISEIITKLIQNILSKIVKPILIPKMDFSKRN